MSSRTLLRFNNNFIRKLLINSEHDDTIEVKNVSFKPATGKGDNYLSDMIRANCEYSRIKSDCEVTENKSLMIKIAPDEGNHKVVVKEIGVFETEIQMMETTLGKMNEMLTMEDCRLSPRVLYTEIGDPSLIVVEDLIPLGYRMADRQIGLNIEHCDLVMRNLADFHATSVALSEKDPKIKTTYTKGLFNETVPQEWKDFFKSTIINLANEVDSWTELGPRRHCYSQKISNLSETCYERAIECMAPKNDEFNVLNHGDAWVNNMMFRYNDDGNVISHIFVDFQLSVWTSPAIDLSYFFSTSLSDEVSLNERDDLLGVYVNTLTKTMKRLGCKTEPPSIETLKNTLREREIYSVLTSFTILPTILVDKNNVVSPNEFGKTKENGSPALKGHIYRRRLAQMLPEWYANGILDI